MTVDTTWTNPSTLDKATKATLPSADVNEILSNLNKLGGSDGVSGTVKRFTVASKTADYTATTADDVILVDATSAAVTITLPTAVGIDGKRFEIKKSDSSANAVTIDPDSSETVDGATTKAINAQYQSYSVVSDGTNWVIV